MSRRAPSAVETAGGILPRDLLTRVGQGDETLEGTDEASYHIPKNERIGEAIDRSWSRLRGLWESFREYDELGPAQYRIAETRSEWLLPFFESLGYGRLQRERATEIEGKSFAISHFWEHVPIHLVGAGMSIDRRTPGAPGGAKAAPHSLVQEFLNRSDEHLWAFVSNGLVLRVLRDSESLSRQAYLEFDLEAIFDGELYSDFRLLWLTCHQSRVEGERPEDCYLEQWCEAAREQGVRALDDLRDGVEQAIEALGAGFLRHPANGELRTRLSSEVGATDQFYRELLRLIYRLIFLFVAEDRDVLLDPDAPPETRDRYRQYYASDRLRELAGRKRGTTHSDLWTALRAVLDHLYEGYEPLALPALGSFLWSPDALPWIGDQELHNDDLLLAIRHLCYTEKDGNRFPVSWRTLGSEELGSVYESLLELHPRMNSRAGEFELTSAAGNERKTTGSYYTPTSLVDALLDSALEPVLERCMKEDDPEQALLDLKVCDTAAGSGHFLVAAARRIAMRLASARTGDEEASPESVSHALRDVVGRCIYGVDLNPLAVDLCKVSLWMEALEPGKPLSFLDHHIQVGNSLLGTTPRLLAEGIPEDAFKPIEGDDKAICRELKKRNKQERGGQTSMYAALVAEPSERYAPLEDAVAELNRKDDDSLDAVRAKEAQWRKLRQDPRYEAERLAADAWCAAFVWEKRKGAPPAITEEGLRQIQADRESVPSEVLSEINDLAAEFGFFHFHLAFMDVFHPAAKHALEVSGSGWSGGFDVVLGNPPWEHAELKEKEWFASRRPDIAAAPNKAARQDLIDELAQQDPELHTAFVGARREADGFRHMLRHSGRYPLCGRGRINTYAVFAEGNRSVMAPLGRLGIVVPSGIATDDTTKFFFQDLVESETLVSLYDFENRQAVFPGVHRSYKFCLLTVGGCDSSRSAGAEFAFFLHQARDLADPQRTFTLTADEIELLNPNTKTCPIFRTRKDAEISKLIYRRFPVLLREGSPDQNPWGISFKQGLFNMASDSDLFRTREELERDVFSLHGNVFTGDGERFLPLFEAKMLHQFDHRWATYDGSQWRQVTSEEKLDATFEPLGRYWVHEAEVDEALRERWNRGWLLGWRNVCRSTDTRTLIATVFPRTAVGHSEPLMFSQEPDTASVLCLYAFFNSLVCDYVVRQKLGGINLTFSTLYQIPVPTRSTLLSEPEWTSGRTIRDWILERTLPLVVTSESLLSVAHEAGRLDVSVERWDAEARRKSRAELDAAFLLLCGVQEHVEHILDSFIVLREREEERFGKFRTSVDVRGALAVLTEEKRGADFEQKRGT